MKRNNNRNQTLVLVVIVSFGEWWWRWFCIDGLDKALLLKSDNLCHLSRGRIHGCSKYIFFHALRIKIL